jgi:hypothetical protein
MKNNRIEKFNENSELNISDVSDSSNEVQFLLTLEVQDIEKFNDMIKDIKYRILKGTSDAVELSGTKSSVKIERIK